MKHLAALPVGTKIFVDANIFVLYYNDLSPLGESCRSLLDRTARAELQGFTSSIVAAETIHRVMIAEATQKFNLPTREAVTYLQKHPNAVKELTRHLVVATHIFHLGINILPVTYKDLHRSQRIRSDFGLLTNDSLIVAVMQANKLRHLVTHDAGFSHVKDIQVWRPG